MTTTIQIPAGPSSSPSSFFDWADIPTADRDLPALSPCSPSSSLCSDSDSDSPLSPASPASESRWATAAAEAHAGVHYVLERFPSSGTVCRAPLFAREPLAVARGDRIVIMDEVSEHALRVRVLATGEVGLLPSWNVEGALERLARLNMEFNEAATCPVESRFLRGRRDAALPIAHMHSRCIPFATRYQLSLHTLAYEVDDTSSLDDLLDAEDVDGRASESERARKSVEFARCERPVVFRYPSESLVFAAYVEGEDERMDVAESEDEENEYEWWWSGWEEEGLEEEKEKFEVSVEVRECELEAES